jgi:hypothetical protein
MGETQIKRKCRKMKEREKWCVPISYTHFPTSPSTHTRHPFLVNPMCAQSGGAPMKLWVATTAARLCSPSLIRPSAAAITTLCRRQPTVIKLAQEFPTHPAGKKQENWTGQDRAWVEEIHLFALQSDQWPNAPDIFSPRPPSFAVHLCTSVQHLWLKGKSIGRRKRRKHKINKEEERKRNRRK